MIRDPITVLSDTPIAEAASLILKHKVGCLPVIDKDGFTIGIITDADFLRYLTKEVKTEKNN
jgi:CBS domain-containing protein